MSSRIASARNSAHAHPAVRKLTARRQLATLLAALALAATGMLASSAGRAQAATATESTAALTVLHMMNAERAVNHLPALGWSTALVSSARRHNLTMAKVDVLSHQLPGEPVFSTRISQAGVPWHAAAENIGWSTDQSSRGAGSLETAMYGERPPADGHRLNILSRSVHYVGIDTYIDAHTGKIWLTEDFADVSGPLPLSVHAPVGNLDSATALSGHRVRLFGWAMDPDSKATALYIGIYFDGHYAGSVRAPVARPDVSKVKGAGPYQGYLIVLTLPAGRHAITTYAVNVGLGSGEARLASHIVVV